METRKWIAGIGLLLMLWAGAWAQGGSYSPGAFALGLRTTANIFPGDNVKGLGSGGQFKIGVTKRVNTQWFADVIQSRGIGSTFRKDYHIGWSVQFGLGGEGFGEVGKFRPYILGGQCFDLTQLGIRRIMETKPYFSAAAQLGSGVSFFPVSSFEMSLQGQWMAHLTGDVHFELDDPSNNYIHEEKGFSLEGHLLFTFAANYYFADFKRK